jgi:hypothetical protein
MKMLEKYCHQSTKIPGSDGVLEYWSTAKKSNTPILQHPGPELDREAGKQYLRVST